MVGYVIGEDTGVGAHDSHWQSKHAEIRLQLLVSRGVADQRLRHLRQIGFRQDIFAPRSAGYRVDGG
jgi:hypothetical protein